MADAVLEGVCLPTQERLSAGPAPSWQTPAAGWCQPRALERAPRSAAGPSHTARPSLSRASPGQQPRAAGISGILRSTAGTRKLFVGTADVR